MIYKQKIKKEFSMHKKAVLLWLQLLVFKIFQGH